MNMSVGTIYADKDGAFYRLLFTAKLDTNEQLTIYEPLHIDHVGEKLAMTSILFNATFRVVSTKELTEYVREIAKSWVESNNVFAKDVKPPKDGEIAGLRKD